MSLIGYARVSTDLQDTAAQWRELKAAGCTEIREEFASGAARARPVLAKLVANLGRGDVLVVVRIDRLARSLSHLLEVIETLEAKGAHFRSLGDPIDTTSPQGKFTLQILGATAEFERALIRERTLAGLASAREKGRVGGNPGLRDRNPEAIAKVSRARDRSYFGKLNDAAQHWLPAVRQFRPRLPWEDVVRIINSRHPQAKPWTVERLRRAAGRFVKDELLDRSVLDRAPPAQKDDRILAIIAGIRSSAPDMTLKQIAARLEAMREPTPRGRSKWATSSVAHLLERARQAGLLENDER
ncbi:LOW QUALITY PROTEIN: site-specific recombinases, DNA invertase Pin homologs [Limimaricola cinnabarinus LL-001]|uniref:Site-specific recombinases, DNA invertase Pin homologs n=1 Tax=Limimaricola cinnabarinus LL-001 TaxID=1337093 RepID=U3ANW4_9RHOB|nr:LOW QUALITY PROTEIN: site-specific recombinases, DNA invertase Pin homologs [Limimaricola cinnabarinus LL-001]